MSGEIHLKNVIVKYLYILDRSNIFINIQRSSEKYEDELQWLIKGVQQKGITMNKTMLYVNSIGKCEELYIRMHGLLKEKGISWAYIHWHKNDRNVSCPYRWQIKRENFNYFLFWGRYHKNFDMNCSCWFGNQYPRYKYCTYMGLTPISFTTLARDRQGWKRR